MTILIHEPTAYSISRWVHIGIGLNYQPMTNLRIPVDRREAVIKVGVRITRSIREN